MSEKQSPPVAEVEAALKVAREKQQDFEDTFGGYSGDYFKSIWPPIIRCLEAYRSLAAENARLKDVLREVGKYLLDDGVQLELEDYSCDEWCESNKTGEGEDCNCVGGKLRALSFIAKHKLADALEGEDDG